MGQSLTLHIPEMMTPRSPYLVLSPEDALKERERLIREHPYLIEYQEEIDRRLRNAGNTENRLAVLGIMMESHLLIIHEYLCQLLSLVR